MSGNFFLDTNILIYALDPSEPRKHSVATSLVARVHESRQGVLSHQVVQEFSNTVLRKSAVRLSIEDAEAVYRSVLAPLWKVHSSPALVGAPIEFHHAHGISCGIC
jgi:predicted nucleic acid-binding protein